MNLSLISLGGESSKKILEEAKEYFKKVELIDIRKIEVHTDSQTSVLYKGRKLPYYDCVYIRGSYKYALLQRAISFAFYGKCYTPIAPESFTIGHDKFLTLLELQKAGVRIPKTYLAATTIRAKKLLEEVNYPIIMKIPGGTQGKGVMSADSLASARSMLDTLEVFKQPYIIQEFIETNATDIRAIVAGDSVVAAMKRKAVTGDVRANIHLGGVGSKYELSYDEEKTAIKTAKAVKADICAVDILQSVKGAMVIEVNLSPGLEGITQATKKNVAKIIAKYLYDKTEEFKRIEKDVEAGSVIKDLRKIEPEKEVLMNLDIKGGRIRLPEVVTKITGFDIEDEVVLVANKGKLEIKKLNVKKE